MEAEKSGFVVLNSGGKMPLMGMGTYQVKGREEIFSTIDAGLAAGYRLIDTAACYKNESLIAEALEELLPKYALKRGDVFLTSKLWCKHHGAGKAREGALGSLAALHTDYLDLFLVHWPGVMKKKPDDPGNARARRETWDDLQLLHREGKLRAIGVSNYEVKHLEELLRYAKVIPAVNQCEFHPHNTSKELVDFCRSKGIHFQAYSSLGSPQGVGGLSREPLVNQLAQKHSCSVPQLLLAFGLSQGVSVLPRTSKPHRVLENWKALQVELSREEAAMLAGLSKADGRYCWDPRSIL